MSKPLSARLRLMLYEDIALEVEAMENEFTRLTREGERMTRRQEGWKPSSGWASDDLINEDKS